MIKEKNIAVCLILSIITCGIYSIYWFICLSDDVNSLSKEEGTTGGVLYLILSLLGLGIITYMLMQNEINKFS